MADFKTLKLEELKEWLDQGKDFTLINVLSAQSFSARHIPGSINIPNGDSFAQKVEETVGGKDETVVVHCSSASCQASPDAARKLAESGFENVYDYEGGLADWQEAELPLEGEAVEE